MDPKVEQEIADMMAELRGAFSGMPNATKEADKGLKAFGKAAGKGAGDITKGLGGFALQVGKGDTSFKSLNKVVDITAGAMAGMAKTLPVAGEAIAAGITAAAEAAKFLLDQMDQVAKGFNEMGSVGALTADGMTGLARQFTQSGLGLQSFTKLVADNSQALARMSGIAGDGAEVFSLAVGKLTQGNDDSLRRLGMNADQIGQVVGVFVTQQTRLGRSQNMTATQIAEGAKQYAMELDKLGKLTGLSREQLQKEQDAALSDSRFRANYDEMVANGQKGQADAIMNLKTRFGRFDKEMGQGVMDLTSGAANTESARKLLNSTGGAAQDIIARLKSGEIDEAQANTEMVAALKANKEKLLQNAKYVGDGDSAFLKFAGVSDAIAAGEKSNDQVAAEMQKKQLENTDALTKSTTEAQKSMEGLSRTITQEAMKALPMAAKATAAVTKQMNELAKYIRDTIGGGGDEAKKEAARKSTTAVTARGESQYDEMGNLVYGSQTPSQPQSAKPAEPGSGEPSTPSSGGAKPSGQPDLTSVGTQGKTAQVNKEYASAFQGLLDNLDASGYKINSLGGYVDRDVRNQPGVKSVHAHGAAIDINPAANPLGSTLITDMPEGIGKVAAGLGLGWGGNWRSKKDAMHFSAARSEGGSLLSAANGAILSGPMGGYTPNLTMHGTEAIVPIDTPATTGGGSGMGDMSMMLEQLAKMEELTTIFRNQLSVDQKLLSYSS
jgi:hypothetical protein